MEKLREQIQSVVDIYKSGNLSKAELLAKNLINNNPKIVFLYNLLGLILVEQKKTEQAMIYYEKGVKIDPSYGMIYNNIGLLLFENKTKDNIKKVENLYKKAITLDNKIPEPHNNLGNLYDFIDKIDEAINCYKKAIDINPRFAYAHHNLGSAYVSIGKFEDAKKHFKESLKLNPNFMVTHRSLSRITKYNVNNEHFHELKKIYKNISIEDSKNRIELSFALGKAYEDTKNFDKSFAHYKEANFLARKKIDFSLKLEKEKFKKIKSLYNKNLYDKYENSGCLDQSPIFIIGMPRSCTTLVEQILSSHSKVYGAEEVDFIPYLIKKNFGDNNLRLFFEGIENFEKSSLKKIGEEYIIKMKEISKGSDRSTDKLPINFLYVGFIKLILPKSKIIHCFRNSKDNCLSIFKNQFNSGKIKFAYDMNEITEYYNLYNDLMLYWNNLLPNFIYDIKYEKLISDTKTEIKKLLNYCDLDWSEACLNFHKNKRSIKTASEAQVRNKIYRSSIDSWKNYEKYLNEYFVKLKS